MKVGIIDVGYHGLDLAQEIGELPATGSGVTLNATGCPNAGEDTESKHGTAVAEVVHDEAPDAALYLACGPDPMTFSAAADWLAQQGVQVITSAVGFYSTGRGDGTGEAGSPAEVVQRSRRAGILWVTAAGNQAQLHWTGSAVDANSDGYVEISGTAQDDGFSLPPGGVATVALRWDAWPATTKDLDLLVMDAPQTPTGPGDTHLVALSTRAQAGTVGGLSPTETATFTNTTGSTQQYWVFLAAAGSYPGTRYDLFVAGVGGSLGYATAAGSLTEPATSPYALAVGASRPGSGQVESYSSQGPTIDGRVKPDITGSDAVSTLTYGASGFAETSAAAAHVAGAAALLKGTNPALQAGQVQALLEGRASPARLDNQWGHGTLALGPPGVPQPPRADPFTPLAAPRRILDTRSILGGHNRPFTAGETFTLPVDGVPSDTSAVVVNLTGLQPSERTHLDLYGDLDTPTPAPRTWIWPRARSGPRWRWSPSAPTGRSDSGTRPAARTRRWTWSATSAPAAPAATSRSTRRSGSWTPGPAWAATRARSAQVRSTPCRSVGWPGCRTPRPRSW